MSIAISVGFTIDVGMYRYPIGQCLTKSAPELSYSPSEYN